MTARVVDIRKSGGDAVAYCRYSDPRQNPLSLEQQEQAVREAAGRVGDRIVGVECDAGVSGRSTVGRDGLERAIRRIEAGEGRVLWVWSLKRLARDEADFWSVIWRRVVDKAGASIRSVVEGFDSSNDSARLTGSVYATFAAEDSRQKARDVQRGLRARMEAGYWVGVAPFGTVRTHVTDTNGRPAIKLEIDRQRVRVVRRMHTLSASGIGDKVLARRLGAEGLPSPKGGPWVASTVTHILTNPIYERMGIVSHDLAERVRAARLKRACNAGKRDAQGRLLHGASGTGRAEHLLTGILTCPKCGTGMRVRDGQYRCGGWAGGSCENGLGVHVGVADARVLETLRDRVLSADALAYVRAKLESDARHAERASRGARAKLERERSNVGTKLRRLADAVAAGGGDVRTIVETMRALESRRRQIEADLARPEDARRAVVSLHPATARKLAAEAVMRVRKDAKRARPLVAALLGPARMEIVTLREGKPFYRARFRAHPAAVLALTGTDPHRDTRAI
jgi:site-specific DNA recombinase